MGGLHNMLDIHRSMLFSRRWLGLFLWYCLIAEYIGAVIELFATFGVPFLFWFAPDRVAFLLNALVFLPYVLAIGMINQAVALKFAYNHYNHRRLLFYAPLYIVLRLVNVCARFICLVKYFLGERGSWRNAKQQFIGK